MFWKNKRGVEKLPDKVIVPTKAGFDYIFDLKRKRIVVLIRKGLKGDLTNAEIKETIQLTKNVGKLAAGLATWIPLGIPAHESIHGITVIGLGGKLQNIKIGWPKSFTYWTMPAGFPEKEIIVYLSPVIFEALIGLYLIKYGIKKKNPFCFGYGVASFSDPVYMAINSLFVRTDFTYAAIKLKGTLIKSFGSNPEFTAKISGINEVPIIFLLAAAVYGTAILGNIYIPKINEELITARRTKKLLHKLKEKDYFLYEALGKTFLWKADKLRTDVLKKIMGKKKFEEYNK